MFGSSLCRHARKCHIIFLDIMPIMSGAECNRKRRERTKLTHGNSLMFC